MATTKTAKADRQDVYEIVTDQVLEALESGTVPWRMPWNTNGTMPLSLSTRKPYRGINPFLLGAASYKAGYMSPWWGTYNKIKELGGQVRKGESGTLVTFWKSWIKKETDEATGEKTENRIFVLRYYRVFNAEQADWEEGKAPKFAQVEKTDAEKIADAEKIVDGYADGPSIKFGSDAATYTPSTDTIRTPAVDQFADSAEYYSTLFHEMTHSTGHESRNNRTEINTFSHLGDHYYSKEELVAEMGAAFLMGVAGIGTDATTENSAAYLRSWINVLKGDKKLLVGAAAQAQRASDRILGVEYKSNDEDQES